MPESFSPKVLEYRPEHERSAAWFSAICGILSTPKLNLTCHLQNDGSQIMKYAEKYGRVKVYYFQVWPDGRMQGAREVANSE